MRVESWQEIQPRGKTHVPNGSFERGSSGGVSGESSDLAAQQVLGLLPDRRGQPGNPNYSVFGLDRQTVAGSRPWGERARRSRPPPLVKQLHGIQQGVVNAPSQRHAHNRPSHQQPKPRRFLLIRLRTHLPPSSVFTGSVASPFRALWCWCSAPGANESNTSPPPA